MTMIKKALFPMILGLTLLFGGAHIGLAADIDEGLTTIQGEAGFSNQPLEQTIGNIINVLLGFLGIIFLGMTLYAGWLWMTAGGNPDKIDKAKKWILNGIVGLIIILASFAITDFVIDRLTSSDGAAL